jgi:predicted RNA-binding Zn ribbon-like protein
MESVTFVNQPTVSIVDVNLVSGAPIVGGIVRSVVEPLASGKRPRIKLCANEGSGGAFFDNTRNLSRRWQPYDACGNRANVSAHRRRVASVGTV